MMLCAGSTGASIEHLQQMTRVPCREEEIARRFKEVERKLLDQEQAAAAGQARPEAAAPSSSMRQPSAAEAADLLDKAWWNLQLWADVAVHKTQAAPAVAQPKGSSSSAADVSPPVLLRERAPSSY